MLMRFNMIRSFSISLSLSLSLSLSSFSPSMDIVIYPAVVFHGANERRYGE